MLVLASAAAGETIYKYQRADGRTVYSNRALPGATLIETFEIEFPKAAETQRDPDKGRLDAEGRIRQRLAALEAAWQEVQDARAALAKAEERLRVGVEPLAVESQQLSGASASGEAPALAPPALGGPLPPAPPAAGGPLPSAPPAVGGPMGPRQGGGGRSPQYRERMESLESAVAAARERLDQALRRYSTLR